MKILNFGSLNVDYVYSMDHFVRPGETTSSLKRETFCGGKGLNQSVALARAGAKVYHAGKVGADGEILTNRLNENGVDLTHVQLADCASGHAIIQVDSRGQNCIILYGGANQDIDEAYAKKVLDEFEAGDILLLQNEISSLDFIINYAYDRGMKIALNPSPISEALVNGPLDKVEWFILNEVEGKDITGREEPDDIVAELLRRFKGAKIVLTLGKQGVLYTDGQVTATHGIYDVPVVDTTAAGDTFTGYFLACIMEGLPIEVVLEKASKASSLAVNRAGASDSIPRREEVDTTDIVLDTTK